MSEALRTPWLLPSVLDDLNVADANGVGSGLNQIHNSPKLIQIIQFIENGPGISHTMGHLSDKFHYIVGFFSDSAIGRFSSRHSNWAIHEIQGAIIRLTEYRFVVVPGAPEGAGILGSSVILIIEDFEHVGSDGSSAFGEPRYIMCNPAVIATLQRPAPSSPSKSSDNLSAAAAFSSSITANSFAFTQTLNPTELLFLESACTQTLQREQAGYPKVISDLDWRISEDQKLILAKMELPKLIPFGLDSDVDLSDSEPETRGHNRKESVRVRISSPGMNLPSSPTRMKVSGQNSEFNPLERRTPKDAESQSPVKPSSYKHKASKIPTTQRSSPTQPQSPKRSKTTPMHSPKKERTLAIQSQSPTRDRTTPSRASEQETMPLTQTQAPFSQQPSLSQFQALSPKSRKSASAYDRMRIISLNSSEEISRSDPVETQPFLTQASTQPDRVAFPASQYTQNPAISSPISFPVRSPERSSQPLSSSVPMKSSQSSPLKQQASINPLTTSPRGPASKSATTAVPTSSPMPFEYPDYSAW